MKNAKESHEKVKKFIDLRALFFQWENFYQKAQYLQVKNEHVKLLGSVLLASHFKLQNCKLVKVSLYELG
jgi:hypothetical protein